MLRTILNFLQALIFYGSVKFSKLKGFWKPRTSQHKKVKVTQLALKEGESYSLGECVVTLAKFGIEGKQEVAQKIAATNEMRAKKEKELTEKGVNIMLMNPEQLKEFQVVEWIKQRKAFNEKKFYENLSDEYQQGTK